VKTNTLEIPGRSVYRNGNTTDVQSFPALTKSLIVLMDQKAGDHKIPNAHSIQTYRQLWLQGSQSLMLPDGYTISREGVQPYPLDNQLDRDLVYSSEVYNTCLGRVYEQLRGELDLSVDFAQMGQVKSMLGKSWKALDHASRFLDFVKPKVLKLKRSGRPWRVELDSMWLEFVYGWKPLVSDIYATMEQVNKSTSQYIRIKASAKDVEVYRKDVPNIMGTGITGVCDVTYSRRCRMVLEFKPQNDWQQALGGYTSLNPVSIAWELIPYSFVADWFVDIGGYLRNLENSVLYRADFRAGYVTQGYLWEADVSCNGAVTDVYGTTKLANVKGNIRFAGKARSILGSIPFPALPKFKVNLGASRLISAAALLSQKLSGLRS